MTLEETLTKSRELIKQIYEYYDEIGFDRTDFFTNCKDLKEHAKEYKSLGFFVALLDCAVLDFEDSF